MMKRCQTARTMAKSKALDCAVQCCSSLVSWAVGDAKFFGNEKPNGPATCYWPAIAPAPISLRFHFQLEICLEIQSNSNFGDMGGPFVEWPDDGQTDGRTVEHAYNGGRERWLNYFGVGLIQTDHHHHHHRPTLFCQFRNGVVGSAGPLQHFLISNSPFFCHRLLFLLPPLLSRTRQVQIRNDGTNIFG